MALSALSSIALLSPIIASNVIFSARRASKGVDKMAEDPLYGAANINIAGAQVLKGARALKSLAIATDPLLENINKGASQRFLEVIPKDVSVVLKKPVQSVDKVLDFTARNINPIIVGTGAYNIMASDDKVDTWARESTSLLTMFGAEAAASDLVGMPNFNTINGKNKIGFKQARTSRWMKKILSPEQCSAVNKLLNKNKATKFAASSAKGLVFATSSILGYNTGKKITDVVLGEKKSS